MCPWANVMAQWAKHLLYKGAYGERELTSPSSPLTTYVLWQVCVHGHE